MSVIDFSTMVLSMYVDADEDPAEDERIRQAAIDQSLLAGELGFNPWYTEHHFRGPWHSAPIQFAACIAPQLPEDRYLGFGVLSVPYHHPVRLVEQMEAGYHRSGRAARDSLEIMERLWDFAPAFLGSFGADLETQLPLYRATLEAAGHPDAVVAECLRWSTVDWLSVVVAERHEDVERLVRLARRERMQLRERFLAHAPEPVHGPAVARPGAVPTPAQFAAGGDMTDVIAGTPDEVGQPVRHLQQLGVNHLLLRFLGEWRGATRWIAEQSMRLFAQQVMPELSASGADDSRELAGRTG